jgi:hypothetical protein
MKRLSLNSLQILHQTNPSGCPRKMCALHGCDKCMCGKRSDAKACCEEHKSELNNQINAKKNYQINTNRKLNIKNTRIVIDLYNRGIRQLDIGALKITGFDFLVSPVPGILYGRTVALYSFIAMWVDAEKIIHLDRLP